MPVMMQEGLVMTVAGWLRNLLLLLLGSEVLTDIIMQFVGIGAVIGVILTAAIVFTYAERKVCALIQVRLGQIAWADALGSCSPSPTC